MWVFESSTGKLFNPDGTFAASGYAGGNCGKNPEGVNNPDMQNVHDIGPLPEGVYTFGKPIEVHPKLGKFCIPLISDKNNQMFGRSAFYMHGDKASVIRAASEGCIIMLNAIRRACAASPDQQIRVVRKYEPAL